MTPIERLFPDFVVGDLTTFDRLIFRGHLSRFFPEGAFQRFLSSQGVLLKDFGSYVAATTEKVKAHAQALAAEARRPFIYLAEATTKASGQSKEDLARQIAERDKVKEGLVCVFSVLELCWSFGVRGNRETHRLEAVLQRRKCLHFYFYFLDRELGFMHVRLQSWFPFGIQVWVNGRAWLSRQLDAEKISYEPYQNCLLRVGDLRRAKRLCERFAHRRWPRLLNAFARRVNPVLPLLGRLGFGSYYWVIDQCEVSTDVMFRDRKTLEPLLPDLLRHATLAFSAEDVMRFLGRKLVPQFQGEVLSDLKKHPQGWRIKHRMKRNSVKLYDKWSVLRVETTVNNPREFRVLRTVDSPEGRTRRWCPMAKGVSNLWRYAQVGEQSNGRYLEALAQVQPKGKAVAELDDLCRSRLRNGRPCAKLNPVSAHDSRVFAAVMAGEHAINGFRNRDLQARLFPSRPASQEEAKARCGRVSRLLAKLRGHSLLLKVPNSRLYRVTPRGYRVMTAALRFRELDFPREFLRNAS